MTDPQIFAITLLLLTALYLYLSINVLLMRRKLQIPYTHEQENRQFMACVSAQRNFNDYTPLTIVLLFLWLHFHPNELFFAVICAMYVLARCLHAIGILYSEQQDRPSLHFRKAGILLTFLSLAVCAISAVSYSFM